MDYSDYSTAPAATTSGSNPYALSHQNSARARAKAYMRQLISTGAAASSFASPPSTSSVSSSASSSSLPAVDRARTLPTTNMSQQNAMPARFSPVGGSNRLNPSPGLNEPYPSTSSLPRPSQQQRSQGYAQQGFATIDRSGGWGQAQSNTQQLSRPVNGIPKAPTGDITMMVPNRKLTTGSKYVTARQMKTQQTKPSQPLPSNGLSIQPSRRLNTDPKQGSMPLDSPNVDPVMSSINISLNSSAAMGNQMPYLRPTFGGAMQGRLYPDSARTSGSSMQPDSPHHVRNFQKTHPSVYTFPEEAEWEDMQEEDSFEPSSPVAARKESVATSAALSPTASTVVQDDTVSDDRELSFKQEISPPSSAPTSPMMGQRKRAFSNSRNAGTFESPVASLLGRLDQALTAALSRVPEADEVGGMDPASLTPISAVTPIHRGSADGMVFVENPKIDNEVYETHSKNLDSMLSSQSPLTEVAAAAEETFIELSSPPVPPLRSASLRGRADGSRKVRTRASRTILRKRSTREKLLENAAVKRSSRRTSVDSNSINGRESEQRSSFTPSKESDRFRIPSNDGPDIGSIA
ncbi:hypothetical protein BC829DRAFT_126000 [Chytridium lagenaria]|nr:hypothetical protein BC829DRAFT_126000 [Chytridium lagenaria]